jgi:hypothetical protein
MFTFDSRVSRLFDKIFNLIILKEVLLKQQRLLNTFNFIIIPPQRSCRGVYWYISFARISLTIERKKSFICAAKHLTFAQIFYLRFTCCNPSIAQITCNFSISDLRMTARTQN